MERSGPANPLRLPVTPRPAAPLAPERDWIAVLLFALAGVLLFAAAPGVLAIVNWRAMGSATATATYRGTARPGSIVVETPPDLQRRLIVADGDGTWTATRLPARGRTFTADGVVIEARDASVDRDVWPVGLLVLPALGIVLLAAGVLVPLVSRWRHRARLEREGWA